MRSKRKLVQGVGINDANYNVNQNGKRCPYYKVWQSMIDRCYSKRIHKLSPSYSGCSVCNDWLLFSNFKAWMIEQNWELKQLDKDIIKPGNKIYSPETCCFVDNQLNTLLVNLYREKDNGLPVGVTFDDRMKTRKFSVMVSLNGVNSHIGRFETKDQAGNAYIDAKHKNIIEAAKSQKDKRIRDGLMAHAKILKSKKRLET